MEQRADFPCGPNYRKYNVISLIESILDLEHEHVSKIQKENTA